MTSKQIIKNELIQKIIVEENYDKTFDISDGKYIYISCKNEIRKIVEQNGNTIAVLIACFAFGRFMWC